ncbi:CBS domain-containing protein [Nitrospira sp. Kam-Ns4a]
MSQHLAPRSDRQDKRGDPLDENISRLREQLAHLTAVLTKTKAQAAPNLEDFDLDTERVITRAFGEASELLEAYQYAQLGDASGLVNLTEEAPEVGTHDAGYESLLQRKRVLESCLAELEARRAQVGGKPVWVSQAMIGPQVADHMTADVRSVHADASLKEAAWLMRDWKVGSLLVADDRRYVGVITDTDLAREVVAGGLDPAVTPVRRCMRQPPVTIEADRPIIEAVRLMKEQATRHLAVTQDGQIIGVISVSNILRYYSGVA